MWTRDIFVMWCQCVVENASVFVLCSYVSITFALFHSIREWMCFSITHEQSDSLADYILFIMCKRESRCMHDKDRICLIYSKSDIWCYDCSCLNCNYACFTISETVCTDHTQKVTIYFFYTSVEFQVEVYFL